MFVIVRILLSHIYIVPHPEPVSKRRIVNPPDPAGIPLVGQEIPLV
jgi:hypothetical protein